MSNRLIQTVAFVNVASGATVALPHELNNNGQALVPDFVWRDNGNFIVVGATATTVTVRNNGPGADSCNVCVERKHSIPRVLGGNPLVPAPFIPAVGGSASLGVYQTIADTGTNNTASLVYTPMPNTAIVVVLAGTYLCLFNGILHGNNPNNLVYFTFAVNNVVVLGERHLAGNNDKAAVLMQPVTVAAGDTLEVQWKVDGGTGQIHDRNVTIVRIA